MTAALHMLTHALLKSSSLWASAENGRTAFYQHKTQENTEMTHNKKLK